MVKGVKDATKLPKLQLSAVVCYYGKHYSTFVFHTKLNMWVYFDDTNVREVNMAMSFQIFFYLAIKIYCI